MPPWRNARGSGSCIPQLPQGRGMACSSGNTQDGARTAIIQPQKDCRSPRHATSAPRKQQDAGATSPIESTGLAVARHTLVRARLLELNDTPSAYAFWRTAPSVRPSLRPMRRAGVLARAKLFNSRTSSFDHSRLLAGFLATGTSDSWLKRSPFYRLLRCNQYRQQILAENSIQHKPRFEPIRTILLVKIGI